MVIFIEFASSSVSFWLSLLRWCSILLTKKVVIMKKVKVIIDVTPKRRFFLYILAELSFHDLSVEFFSLN